MTARRAATLTLLTVIVAGLPVTLWMLGGPPLHWPDHLPAAGNLRSVLADVPDNTGLVLTVARLAAWIGWVWFTLALAAEAYGRLRGRAVRRVRGTTWMQDLAARALTAATVGVAGTVPMINAATASVTVAAVHTEALVRMPSARTHDDVGSRLYTVREGDTLWGIASRQLGDPLRFREIAALNLGRVMDDGQIFRNAGWIYPGWVLRLPAAPAPGITTSAERSAADTGQHRRTDACSAHGPRSSVAHHDGHPASAIRLPSGAIVGISFAAAVSGAVLLARAHRNRTRTVQRLDEDAAVGEPPLPRSVAVMRQAHLDLGVQPAHVLPLLDSPGGLVCAHAADGSELRLDLAAVGGFGLTGPGAADAARALLCGLLAGSRRDPVQVLVTAPDLRELLGTDPDGADLPVRLVVVTDLDAALTWLEAGRLRHARDLNDDGPVTSETNVLVTRVPPDNLRSRLESLLSSQDGYCAAAIVLGDWFSGTTCRVATGGVIESVTGKPLPWPAGASLFTLSPADALDVLHVTHDAGHPAGHMPLEPPADSVPAQPEAGDSERKDHAKERPVHITVLGPPSVHVRGTEIASGLRTDARNLLSLLAVHKDGMTIEAAADILWPDAPLASVSSRFHTALTNIRSALRKASGARSAMFVTRVAGRYRLDPALIDCDLWRFEESLTWASRGDESSRVRELRRAVDRYTGLLLDRCGQEWAEPPRESIRRRAADALRQLADLTWDHDPDAALGYLDRALAIDEYNEELHQHLMCRQATVGRYDAVRRTYQHLERCLAGIDATPDRASRILFDDLVSRP
jgi:DNA-binding SARP family transcriptional activator